MDPSIYNAFLLVAAVIISISFLMMTWRILVGPNSLDRVLGLDGFIAMLQCALATYICWTLDTTVANAMLVVALLGFIASVSVARFRKRDGA
ncbi:Na(+)/H(+) antiporter subunit F [Corynebacterium atrinae]|uniref:Multisubunit Na+/H+ antiporter, MnhF subunit n=1 Tax=Corynebacterium testudinoris TaxID=136857 RepID=A0A0G3HAJ5_9CORY|nr:MULTISPECIES: monovalent cation/H+ antiporter complex subunit F [Corynebacterium]AKK09770.1 multisubunit Na+/H+ antiporter, MnhF subunit [Corynebacterium testudinoris]MBX8996742.1 cation:proton antiporter [Corynebacterium testudinoris]WJY64385.1 Na(+)/H(+) antiporter subunit F [Corynebacterium atrinae]